jgi:DNA helicase HerA-like ATPase
MQQLSPAVATRAIRDEFQMRREGEGYDSASNASLGRVVAVDGARAVISAKIAHAIAQRDNPLSIGKLVCIDCGASRVLGLIYSAAADQSPGPREAEATLVKVELVGAIHDRAASGHPAFDRGIQRYPAVGAPVHGVQAADLAIIYDHGGDEVISVGRLSQDPSIEATVRVQDLLQKHFAVLGTTGCGKSSAVALLLREIMSINRATRILLIDPHNEYRAAFADRAEVVSPRNLNLPFWLFNFEEITDVFYRRRPGVEDEIDALAELIPLAKARYGQRAERSSSLLRKESVEDGGHTVDSPVPYRISDLMQMIEEQLGRLDGKDDRPRLRRLRARIQSVAQDTRYQFMFSHRTIEDTMADLLKTLFRIPKAGRPLTIVEMAGFPAEVVDAVVSVLCRMAFDLGMWGNGRVPLVVVCEEAHRYVPADKRLGFGPTRRAISRIAKEGRKYGVSLGVITQRPAELDPTILSQCSTVFAMRMANEADHAIIRSAVSDAAASTLESLPSMGNREALAFGEAVSMPMRVRFTSLAAHELPNSQLASPIDESGDQTESFVDDVVRRWRSVAERE